MSVVRIGSADVVRRARNLKRRVRLPGGADDDDAAATRAALIVGGDVVGTTTAAAEPVDAALGLIFVTAVGKRVRLARGNGDIARPVATAAYAAIQYYSTIVKTAATTTAGVVDLHAGNIRDPARATRTARDAGLGANSAIHSRTARAAAAADGVRNHGTAARISLTFRSRAAHANVSAAASTSAGNSITYTFTISSAATAANGREERRVIKRNDRVAAIAASAVRGLTTCANGNHVGASRKNNVVSVDHAARAAAARALAPARATAANEEETRFDLLINHNGT